jgi:peptidoglycan/xylan/chitin deacetylase (PgdA/CDA1 family)
VGCAVILKSVVSLLSPRGAHARLTILIFHRVLACTDPLFPDEPNSARFNEILTWVGRWFQVMPLDDALLMMRCGSLPERAAAITFDDGYADNVTNALPILKAHGITATFFIATSFLDGGRMWNDSVIETVRNFPGKHMNLGDAGLGTYHVETVAQRRDAIRSLIQQIKYLAPTERRMKVEQVIDGAGVQLPCDLMMRSDQVVTLRDAGMQIGAHTVTHPILTQLNASQARMEIQSGKKYLESLLNLGVTLFAYPNGRPDADYSTAHVAMVREAGYAAAVTTAPGAAMNSSDLYQLPRFTPWDRTSTRYGIRLLANLRTSVLRVDMGR